MSLSQPCNLGLLICELGWQRCLDHGVTLRFQCAKPITRGEVGHGDNAFSFSPSSPALAPGSVGRGRAVPLPVTATLLLHPDCPKGCEFSPSFRPPETKQRNRLSTRHGMEADTSNFSYKYQSPQPTVTYQQGPICPIKRSLEAGDGWSQFWCSVIMPKAPDLSSFFLCFLSLLFPPPSPPCLLPHGLEIAAMAPANAFVSTAEKMAKEQYR